MTSELTDLYQDLLLDHARHPHNFRAMETASRIVEGYNPLYGDDVALYLRVEGDRIADISFQDWGCAISTASASMLTDRIKGRTVAEAEQLFDAVHDLLIVARPFADQGDLGELAALEDVSKCAMLSWHALKAALRDQGPEIVTTE